MLLGSMENSSEEGLEEVITAADGVKGEGDRLQNICPTDDLDIGLRSKS